MSELVLVKRIIIMSSHPGIRIWIEYRVFEYLPPLPAGDRVGCRVGDRDGSFVGCRVGNRVGDRVGAC